jgi:single-strand DNA-binding protein
MLNHIVILGRLTRDPEMRTTGTGVNVCNFTVAVDRDFASGPNKEKETDFIDCVAWRKTGEFVGKYFRKGSMIAVSGRLEIRKWTDKDGNQRRSAEVNAENVYFGGSKNEGGASPAAGGAAFTVSPDSYYAKAEQAAMDAMYGGPVTADNYAMLTDDDSQLPF